jgi:3-deoxy-D-manno-octulosonic-acid transferase
VIGDDQQRTIRYRSAVHFNAREYTGRPSGEAGDELLARARPMCVHARKMPDRRREQQALSLPCGRAYFRRVAWIDRAWDIGLTLAKPLVEAAGRSSERGRRAISGRRASLRHFEMWTAASRTATPLVWLHAPSVGEALMAQAIVSALRAQADVQIAFTHFSPSAERVVAQVGADVSGYLPWDTPQDVRHALDLLRPAVLVFVRTEIWPGLVRAAHARGVPVALVNAPLAVDSSRLRPVARAALRTAWSLIDGVGAVAEEDAARFAGLGIDPARIRVTGDARFDQAAARVGRMNPDSPLLRRLRDPTVVTLVAGSTWPQDDDIVLDAFARIRSRLSARLIVAPHEPEAAGLDRLMKATRSRSLACARLDHVEGGSDSLPDVILIDRVGVLAELYAAGSAAYVGGGFGRRGLHSVIEPAALGLPVAFGPRAGNAREAVDLAAAGGGAMVTDAASLTAALEQFLASAEPGERARAFVQARSGGAERNAGLIAHLLAGPRQRAGLTAPRSDEGGS